MHHSVLDDVLSGIKSLFEDVKRKALMRLEYEGLHKAPEITTAGSKFHNDPTQYAMHRYAYYVCFKCGKVRYQSLIFYKILTCTSSMTLDELYFFYTEMKW